MSQSASNMFKTLPFITDFMRHKDTHALSISVTLLIHIVNEISLCRRAGNCSAEDDVPATFPELTTASPEEFVAELTVQLSSAVMFLESAGHNACTAVGSVFYVGKCFPLRKTQTFANFTLFTRELMDKTDTPVFQTGKDDLAAVQFEHVQFTPGIHVVMCLSSTCPLF